MQFSLLSIAHNELHLPNVIMKPDQDTKSPRSQLFSVRVWREEVAANQHEWRGKVQHVTSGEAYHFRTWPNLITHLLKHSEQQEMTTMTSINTNAVHHIALTVSDVARSQAFYTTLLGFELAAEFGPRVLLSNGSMILALTPPPDPDQAIANDRFNENRIGLDHLSFGVGNHAELEVALRLFDEQGVSHGEIKDLEPFGIYVLAFRDPDNIQLELTAPYS